MYHGSGVRVGRRIVTSILVVLVMAWILFPLFWMVVGAFKHMADFATSTPQLIFTPTLDNFIRVLSNETLMVFIRNSAIVAPTSVLLALVLGVPAAYALARNPSKGKETIGNLILILRMIPPVALVLPIFVLYSPRYFNLQNTHIGLILIYTAFNIPLVVWIVRGFIEDIPSELEEVAMIAGMSRFMAFLRIIVPLSLPGLISASMICMILTWNEYLFAIVIVGTEDVATLPVGLQQMMDWGGGVFAVSLLIVAPLVVFIYLGQDYLVSGLTMGTVKG